MLDDNSASLQGKSNYYMVLIYCPRQSTDAIVGGFVLHHVPAILLRLLVHCADILLAVR